MTRLLSPRHSPRARLGIVAVCTLTTTWALVAAVAPASLGDTTSAQPAASARLGPSPQPAALTSAMAAVRVPTNVRIYQTRRSILGVHTWYQQVKRGHPVVNGWYAVHAFDHGKATVYDGRKDAQKLASTKVRVSPTKAASRVAGTDRRAAKPVTSDGLMVLPGRPAHLVWQVITTDSRGVTATYVDAATGKALHKDRLSQHVAPGPAVDTTSRSAATSQARRADGWVRGNGRVFDPNPVASLQREGLTDQRDKNYAALAHAYRRVPLQRLDKTANWLKGRWVRIVNSHKARSSDRTFLYNRGDARFEQVNGYHAIDVEQGFLRSLGFFDVNAESQRLKTNAFGADNSFYDPNADQISMGTGGVDDAEDVEVTWHEYGHAIQDDQVPNFGATLQSGAIGEGFGDYMAATMSQAAARNTAKTPWACVMDWDSTSYTNNKPHCLRRTDTHKTYDDRVGEVHADGEIWSGALWKLNAKLRKAFGTQEGRDKATKIIVEAQFMFTPGITMPQARKKTVDAATKLFPGDPSIADATRAAFDSRKIPPPA